MRAPDAEQLRIEELNEELPPIVLSADRPSGLFPFPTGLGFGSAEHQGHVRKFWFYIEGFNPLEAKLQLGISTGDPALEHDIDIERDLGGDNDLNRGRVRGGYRFSRRHEIEFSYLQIGRRNELLLTEDFLIGDNLVMAGLQLQSNLETTDLELAYTYYFLQSSNGELGLTTGLHVTDASYEIDGTIELPVGDGAFDVDFVLVDREQITIPLPFLGFQGKAQLTQKLWLTSLIKLLDVTVGDYDGSWTTFEALLEHRTFKHLGFGVGYYLNDLQATKEGALGAGSIASIELENSGLAGFLRLQI